MCVTCSAQCLTYTNASRLCLTDTSNSVHPKHLCPQIQTPPLCLPCLSSFSPSSREWHCLEVTFSFSLPANHEHPPVGSRSRLGMTAPLSCMGDCRPALCDRSILLPGSLVQTQS